ncbi:uncharacterized protein LOC125944083 [Dermacentor silvarum]|uniref:uncharacterized protein LOC125944083 n=1 Tax=Dermacentor silvarum TaxID=543639 RepID=UPI00210177E9|nr:uncharacterized protein LOC125944083 [Dermacentor silvarum]
MAQDQTVIEKRQRDSYPQSCTPDQWAVMLDFLCVHTGLGRPTNEMRSETRQRLWSELTSLLNALGPIARSREEWRQYWQQRVATARQRAAELSNAVSRLPSGSEKRASPVGLSEDDARVLSVVGDEVALEVVEGHVVQKRRERQSPSGSLYPVPYQAVPQASTAATEATTSRKQRTHDYLARLTEAQERLTQLREQQAAEDTNFRTQVLRRFEEAQATTTRQIAIAEHQARVMDELAATMQNILRLLARDSQQPPPKHSKQ